MCISFKTLDRGLQLEDTGALALRLQALEIEKNSDVERNRQEKDQVTTAAPAAEEDQVIVKDGVEKGAAMARVRFLFYSFLHII